MTAPTPAPRLGYNRRQVARNSVAASLSLLVTMVVGILYTPFMLRSLGPTVYGLVPLMSSVTSYFSALTISVCGIVARNLTAELARGDLDRASQQFNTFFRVGLMLAGALFACSLVFSVFLPLAFNIPADQVPATRILFISVSLAFLLSVVSTTFESGCTGAKKWTAAF